MKYLLFILPLLLILTSCNNTIQKEDPKITIDFLSGSYNSKFHELNLSNQNLTQIPNFEKYLTGNYIDDVWSIDLSNNNITDIDTEKFKYFPNLKEINLSYNNLENITLEHNFLQELKLHKNKLTKVDLSGLTNLNTLSLGYNELLTGNDMKLPNKLKILELQHNKLEDLNQIEELINLQTLKLEFNNLEESDLKVLKNFKNLKIITLGGNELIKKETIERLNKFSYKNEKEMNGGKDEGVKIELE